MAVARPKRLTSAQLRSLVSSKSTATTSSGRSSQNSRYAKKEEEPVVPVQTIERENQVQQSFEAKQINFVDYWQQQANAQSFIGPTRPVSVPTRILPQERPVTLQQFTPPPRPPTQKFTPPPEPERVSLKATIGARGRVKQPRNEIMPIVQTSITKIDVERKISMLDNTLKSQALDMESERSLIWSQESSSSVNPENEGQMLQLSGRYRSLINDNQITQNERDTLNAKLKDEFGVDEDQESTDDIGTVIDKPRGKKESVFGSDTVPGIPTNEGVDAGLQKLQAEQDGLILPSETAAEERTEASLIKTGDALGNAGSQSQSQQSDPEAVEKADASQLGDKILAQSDPSIQGQQMLQGSVPGQSSVGQQNQKDPFAINYAYAEETPKVWSQKDAYQEFADQESNPDAQKWIQPAMLTGKDIATEKKYPTVFSGDGQTVGELVEEREKQEQVTSNLPDGLNPLNSGDAKPDIIADTFKSAANPELGILTGVRDDGTENYVQVSKEKSGLYDVERTFEDGTKTNTLERFSEKIDPTSDEGKTIQNIYAKQYQTRIENAEQSAYFWRLTRGEASISEALLKPRSNNVFFKGGVKQDGIDPAREQSIRTFFGERGISLNEEIGSIKFRGDYSEARSRASDTSQDMGDLRRFITPETFRNNEEPSTKFMEIQRKFSIDNNTPTYGLDGVQNYGPRIAKKSDTELQVEALRTEMLNPTQQPRSSGPLTSSEKKQVTANVENVLKTATDSEYFEMSYMKDGEQVTDVVSRLNLELMYSNIISSGGVGEISVSRTDKTKVSSSFRGIIDPLTGKAIASNADKGDIPTTTDETELGALPPNVPYFLYGGLSMAVAYNNKKITPTSEKELAPDSMFNTPWNVEKDIEFYENVSGADGPIGDGEQAPQGFMLNESNVLEPRADGDMSGEMNRYTKDGVKIYATKTQAKEDGAVLNQATGKWEIGGVPILTSTYSGYVGDDSDDIYRGGLDKPVVNVVRIAAAVKKDGMNEEALQNVQYYDTFLDKAAGVPMAMFSGPEYATASSKDTYYGEPTVNYWGTFWTKNLPMAVKHVTTPGEDGNILSGEAFKNAERATNEFGVAFYRNPRYYLETVITDVASFVTPAGIVAAPAKGTILAARASVGIVNAASKVTRVVSKVVNVPVTTKYVPKVVQQSKLFDAAAIYGEKVGQPLESAINTAKKPLGSIASSVAHSVVGIITDPTGVEARIPSILPTANPNSYFTSRYTQGTQAQGLPFVPGQVTLQNGEILSGNALTRWFTQQNVPHEAAQNFMGMITPSDIGTVTREVSGFGDNIRELDQLSPAARNEEIVRRQMTPEEIAARQIAPQDNIDQVQGSVPDIGRDILQQSEAQSTVKVIRENIQRDLDNTGTSSRIIGTVDDDFASTSKNPEILKNQLRQLDARQSREMLSNQLKILDRYDDSASIFYKDPISTYSPRMLDSMAPKGSVANLNYLGEVIDSPNPTQFGPTSKSKIPDYSPDGSKTVRDVTTPISEFDSGQFNIVFNSRMAKPGSIEIRYQDGVPQYLDSIGGVIDDTKLLGSTDRQPVFGVKNQAIQEEPRYDPSNITSEKSLNEYKKLEAERAELEGKLLKETKLERDYAKLEKRLEQLDESRGRTEKAKIEIREERVQVYNKMKKLEAELEKDGKIPMNKLVRDNDGSISLYRGTTIDNAFDSFGISDSKGLQIGPRESQGPGIKLRSQTTPAAARWNKHNLAFGTPYSGSAKAYATRSTVAKEGGVFNNVTNKWEINGVPIDAGDVGVVRYSLASDARIVTREELLMKMGLLDEDITKSAKTTVVETAPPSGLPSPGQINVGNNVGGKPAALKLTESEVTAIFFDNIDGVIDYAKANNIDVIHGTMNMPFPPVSKKGPVTSTGRNQVGTSEQFPSQQTGSKYWMDKDGTIYGNVETTILNDKVIVNRALVGEQAVPGSAVTPSLVKSDKRVASIMDDISKTEAKMKDILKSSAPIPPEPLPFGGIGPVRGISIEIVDRVPVNHNAGVVLLDKSKDVKIWSIKKKEYINDKASNTSISYFGIQTEQLPGETVMFSKIVKNPMAGVKGRLGKKETSIQTVLINTQSGVNIDGAKMFIKSQNIDDLERWVEPLGLSKYGEQVQGTTLNEKGWFVHSLNPSETGKGNKLFESVTGSLDIRKTDDPTSELSLLKNDIKMKEDRLVVIDANLSAKGLHTEKYQQLVNYQTTSKARRLFGNKPYVTYTDTQGKNIKIYSEKNRLEIINRLTQEKDNINTELKELKPKVKDVKIAQMDQMILGKYDINIMKKDLTMQNEQVFRSHETVMKDIDIQQRLLRAQTQALRDKQVLEKIYGQEIKSKTIVGPDGKIITSSQTKVPDDVFNNLTFSEIEQVDILKERIGSNMNIDKSQLEATKQNVEKLKTQKTALEQEFYDTLGGDVQINDVSDFSKMVSEKTAINSEIDYQGLSNAYYKYRIVKDFEAGKITQRTKDLLIGSRRTTSANKKGSSITWNKKNVNESRQKYVDAKQKLDDFETDLLTNENSGGAYTAGIDAERGRLTSSVSSYRGQYYSVMEDIYSDYVLINRQRVNLDPKPLSNQELRNVVQTADDKRNAALAKEQVTLLEIEKLKTEIDSQYKVAGINESLSRPLAKGEETVNGFTSVHEATKYNLAKTVELIDVENQLIKLETSSNVGNGKTINTVLKVFKKERSRELDKQIDVARSLNEKNKTTASKEKLLNAEKAWYDNAFNDPNMEDVKSFIEKKGWTLVPDSPETKVLLDKKAVLKNQISQFDDWEYAKMIGNEGGSGKISRQLFLQQRNDAVSSYTRDYSASPEFKNGLRILEERSDLMSQKIGIEDTFLEMRKVVDEKGLIANKNRNSAEVSLVSTMSRQKLHEFVKDELLMIYDKKKNGVYTASNKNLVQGDPVTMNELQLKQKILDIIDFTKQSESKQVSLVPISKLEISIKNNAVKRQVTWNKTIHKEINHETKKQTILESKFRKGEHVEDIVLKESDQVEANLVFQTPTLKKIMKAESMAEVREILSVDKVDSMINDHTSSTMSKKYMSDNEMKYQTSKELMGIVEDKANEIRNAGMGTRLTDAKKLELAKNNVSDILKWTEFKDSRIMTHMGTDERPPSTYYAREVSNKIKQNTLNEQVYDEAYKAAESQNISVNAKIKANEDKFNLLPAEMKSDIERSVPMNSQRTIKFVENKITNLENDVKKLDAQYSKDKTASFFAEKEWSDVKTKENARYALLESVTKDNPHGGFYKLQTRTYMTQESTPKTLSQALKQQENAIKRGTLVQTGKGRATNTNVISEFEAPGKDILKQIADVSAEPEIAEIGAGGWIMKPKSDLTFSQKINLRTRVQSYFGADAKEARQLQQVKLQFLFGKEPSLGPRGGTIYDGDALIDGLTSQAIRKQKSNTNIMTVYDQMRAGKVRENTSFTDLEITEIKAYDNAKGGKSFEYNQAMEIKSSTYADNLQNIAQFEAEYKPMVSNIADLTSKRQLLMNEVNDISRGGNHSQLKKIRNEITRDDMELDRIMDSRITFDDEMRPITTALSSEDLNKVKILKETIDEKRDIIQSMLGTNTGTKSKSDIIAEIKAKKIEKKNTINEIAAHQEVASVGESKTTIALNSKMTDIVNTLDKSLGNKVEAGVTYKMKSRLPEGWSAKNDSLSAKLENIETEIKNLENKKEFGFAVNINKEAIELSRLERELASNVAHTPAQMKSLKVQIKKQKILVKKEQAPLKKAQEKLDKVSIEQENAVGVFEATWRTDSGKANIDLGTLDEFTTANIRVKEKVSELTRRDGIAPANDPTSEAIIGEIIDPDFASTGVYPDSRTLPGGRKSSQTLQESLMDTGDAEALALQKQQTKQLLEENKAAKEQRTKMFDEAPQIQSLDSSSIIPPPATKKSRVGKDIATSAAFSSLQYVYAEETVAYPPGSSPPSVSGAPPSISILKNITKPITFDGSTKQFQGQPELGVIPMTQGRQIIPPKLDISIKSTNSFASVLDTKMTLIPGLRSTLNSKLVQTPIIDQKLDIGLKIKTIPRQSVILKQDTVTQQRLITSLVQPPQSTKRPPPRGGIPPGLLPPLWLPALAKKPKKKKIKKKKGKKIAWAVPDVWYGYYDPREYKVVSGAGNKLPDWLMGGLDE